jgi:hypothetical protein
MGAIKQGWHGILSHPVTQSPTSTGLPPISLSISAAKRAAEPEERREEDGQKMRGRYDTIGHDRLMMKEIRKGRERNTDTGEYKCKR